MYVKRKLLNVTSSLKFHSLNCCSNGTPLLSSALHSRYGIIKTFGDIQHGNDFTIFHNREVSKSTYQLKKVKLYLSLNELLSSQTMILSNKMYKNLHFVMDRENLIYDNI